MKLSPISADLVVKLALGAAAIGLLYVVYQRTVGAAGKAAAAAAAQAGRVADAVIVGVNPANPGNWVNQAAIATGSAIVGDTGPGRNADRSWTVGGWLYDVTHPDFARGAAGGNNGQTPVFNPATEELVRVDALSNTISG